MTTTQEPAGPRRSPGRPRDPAVEARIADAALEEYAERGWSGFTIDGVARRAGVGKSTIYLRWDSKESLLVHAVDDRSSGIEDVDTGTLRGDLEEVAANLLRHYLDPIGWATLRISVDEAGGGDPTRPLAATTTHRDAARAVVDRAIARGEVTAQVPVDTLIGCIYGSVTILALNLPPAERVGGGVDVPAMTVPVIEFALAAIRDHLT